MKTVSAKPVFASVIFCILKRFAGIFFLICFINRHVLSQPASAQGDMIIPKNLNYPKLADKFYLLKDQRIFWLQPESGKPVREKLLSLLDSARYMGLDKYNYHYDWIKSNVHFFSADSSEMVAADRIYTDAAISFCKEIYSGAVNSFVASDELSQACRSKDDDYILMGLSSVATANELEWFIRFLEPRENDYNILRKELRLMIDSAKENKTKQLSRTLNLLRWIKHFNLDKYVVVNAGSAVVRYYDSGAVKLRMKAVVGKAATPTPFFAAYCNEIILYPYWHVPYSIAVKEILPIVKRDPSYLNRRGLQVINANGKVLDPYSIAWGNYSAKYFPLQFRQSTGCDNALGVMKFNLTDPYSVYMHDTNNKIAFLAGSRYFSHGCIRLEKPVELANEFLPGKIDTAFLEACYKDLKPVTLKLSEPVPVFVIYMTAEYDDDGHIRYYKDIYRLIR